MSPDPLGRQRKFRVFIALSFGVLALIALQLYLQFSGHKLAAAAVGILLLAVIAFLLWWGRDLRPRRQGSDDG